MLKNCKKIHLFDYCLNFSNNNDSKGINKPIENASKNYLLSLR